MRLRRPLATVVRAAVSIRASYGRKHAKQDDQSGLNNRFGRAMRDVGIASLTEKWDLRFLNFRTLGINALFLFLRRRKEEREQ